LIQLDGESLTLEATGAIADDGATVALGARAAAAVDAARAVVDRTPPATRRSTASTPASARWPR
jgi:histidine ammonia-lyase